MGEVEDLREQVQLMGRKMLKLEMALENKQKDLIKDTILELKKQEQQDPLEMEMKRKFVRNKKSLIKSKIIDTLNQQPRRLSDLKYYIVDQMKYCAKASFYRYIDEMLGHIEIKDGIVHRVTDITI